MCTRQRQKFKFSFQANMSILLKPFLHVSWNQRQPSCFDSVEVKITGTAKILTEKSAETEINSSGLKTI